MRSQRFATQNIGASEHQIIKRNKPELDSLKTGHFQKSFISSSHGLCTLTYQREFSVRKFEDIRLSRTSKNQMKRTKSSRFLYIEINS